MPSPQPTPQSTGGNTESQHQRGRSDGRPDAHPDAGKRWLTGPFYALCHAALAVFVASLVALLTALPPELVATVAGIALIGPFVGALGSALASEEERFAAVLTFVVSASGLSLLGVGAAFWGLVAGLAVLGLNAASPRRRTKT